MSMEYFDQQLAGALKRAGVIVGSWLFAKAPNQSQPGTAFEDPDDSDDEVPPDDSDLKTETGQSGQGTSSKGP